MSLKTLEEMVQGSSHIWSADVRKWKLGHEKLDRELIRLIEKQFPLFHGETRDNFMELKHKILGKEEKKKSLLEPNK